MEAHRKEGYADGTDFKTYNMDDPDYSEEVQNPK